MPDAVQETLLKASALLYLFRALISANAPEQRKAVELQITSLINDVSGTDGGFVVLPSPGKNLLEAAGERDFGPLCRLVERAIAEGIVYDAGVTAGPIYVRRKVEGVIAVLGPNCGEILSAVLTLASVALENGRECENLRSENIALQSLVDTQSSGIAGGIIGESPAIRNLRKVIDKVAPQDATVLILGESGTGKELIARAVHERSQRSRRPFIAINCAALTETLLESELFGHERGSFTGAVAQKKGKLEISEGGTIFLDEVGELAAGMQAKLLRVLQERTFERVGGTATLPLDIRVIAATNRDLGNEARRANFRLDLYHRLNVVALKSPPLRERQEDILLLARHFLRVAAARCHRNVEAFSPDAERCLVRYPWPGNVRELQNAIEHAVILGSSDSILLEDLPGTVLETIGPGDVTSSYHQALGETRRDCVIRAWSEAKGDHDTAARLLGMHPNSLRRLIRLLGIREVLGGRSVAGKAG